eukprot:1326099-Ditylum_brightwellii.AAC.1
MLRYICTEAIIKNNSLKANSPKRSLGEVDNTHKELIAIVATIGINAYKYSLDRKSASANLVIFGPQSARKM